MAFTGVSKVGKSKKDYVCGDCAVVIPSGSCYYNQAQVVDGKFSSKRMCESCFEKSGLELKEKK